jgi:hypothetical protein
MMYADRQQWPARSASILKLASWVCRRFTGAQTLGTEGGRESLLFQSLQCMRERVSGQMQYCETCRMSFGMHRFMHVREVQRL